MRQRAILGAVLLIGAGVILGATVFRADIAQATGLAQAVTVDNTAANPVPVTAASTLPVHEQGTANVNVTNSSLSVAPQSPITSGGQLFQADGGEDASFGGDITASALMVTFTSSAFEVILLNDDRIVARFLGPASITGNRSYQLALNRPVSFDQLRCFGPASETCGVMWIGNNP
jgi:hypothetical protein